MKPEAIQQLVEVYGARKLFKGVDRKKQHLDYEISHIEKLAVDIVKRVCMAVDDENGEIHDQVNQMAERFEKLRKKLQTGI
jgi:uncharacterized coiled-coil DUF342 family protein